MNTHIQTIEIKNYKCFQDFRAKNLKRVNLIGGRNNIGKTSFLEACLLCMADDYSDIYGRLLEIGTHRNLVNRVLQHKKRRENLKNLIVDSSNISIVINEDRELYIKNRDNRYQIKPPLLDAKEMRYGELFDRLDRDIEYSYMAFSSNYISPFSDFNDSYNRGISSLKLENRLKTLNTHIKELFDIDELDYINNQPQLFKNEWKELSLYGQGVKTFVNIMISLLLLEDKILFIDEIENGIHYSLFDKMWEIILKISKTRGVQIFATTHSKECINSYNRVSQRLEDDNITFINLSRNRKDKIVPIVLDSGMFRSELAQNHEVRAW